MIGARAAVGALAGAVAMALAAAPALADGTDPNYPGSVLQDTIQPPADPSSASFTLVASGMNAEKSTLGQPGLEGYTLSQFFVIPGVGPLPCSTSELTEFIESTSTQAKGIEEIDAEVDEGTSGPFSVSVPVAAPIGYTGRVVICSYTNYANDNAAFATTTVNVVVHGDGPPQLGTAPSGGGSGSGTTKSKPTTPTPPKPKPKAIAKPRVARVGRHLFCERGSWSGHPKSYAYRWTVVHKPGVAGKQDSLVVTGKLRGQRVTCSVTATNGNGRTTATSRPVKA